MRYRRHASSRTLSQRACSYPSLDPCCLPPPPPPPPTPTRQTTTLFGLVSMQNYAKRVAVASPTPTPTTTPAPALASVSRSAGAGSMCCAPMRMSFRILGLISRRSAAYQMPGNLNVPGQGEGKRQHSPPSGRDSGLVSPVEPRATSQVPFGIYSFMRCTFAFAAIKHCR